MCFQVMTSHYSLRALSFHFLTRRLKFQNIFVLLRYFTTKSVILAKIAVIKNFSKVSWKNWAYLSHCKLKYNILEENLNKEELESLKNLSKNLDIIIRKSKNGNSVVVLDKKVYLEKMNKMLKKKWAVSKNFHTRRKRLQFFD